MKLTVVVIGDGRYEYLKQTVQVITANVLHPITARIMVDDSGDPDYGLMLDEMYPEYLHDHGGRRGMAGAVQAGFRLALDTDPDYVLWIEEDFVLKRQLPIAQVTQVMNSHDHLAQMLFQRQPLSPDELATGSVIGGMKAASPYWQTHHSYVEHTAIFSMNPCIIPRRVLAMGWPSGPLGVGNEAGMTRKLLESGYTFGVWGSGKDAPYCEHIGEVRADDWAL